MLSSSTNDKIDSTELENVGLRYQQVRDRVSTITSEVGRHNVRLVAVSKTKPIELLEAAYNAGCRHYGENYVQELIEKVALWHDRTDVQWHFIGALQSNKCSLVINGFIPNISQLTVETISSIKLATKLNTAVSNKVSPPSSSNDVDTDTTTTIPLPQQQQQQRLKVFVQVNTSGEDSKSGIEPGMNCIELCRFIVTECPFLELRGLMTIGAPGDHNCFTTLVQCRTDVEADLSQQKIVSSSSTTTTSSTTTPIITSVVPTLELSMGMSDDYEVAIQAGSTNVRVGSTIFGHRNYSTTTT